MQLLKLSGDVAASLDLPGSTRLSKLQALAEGAVEHPGRTVLISKAPLVGGGLGWLLACSLARLGISVVLACAVGFVGWWGWLVDAGLEDGLNVAGLPGDPKLDSMW